MEKKQEIYGVNIITKDGLISAQFGVMIKGKKVVGFENISNEDLDMLISLSMSLSEIITDEYFKRHPDKKDEFERFVYSRN